MMNNAAKNFNILVGMFVNQFIKINCFFLQKDFIERKVFHKKIGPNTPFVWKNRFFVKQKKGLKTFFLKIDFFLDIRNIPIFFCATNLSILHNLDKSTKLFSDLCQTKFLDTLTKHIHKVRNLEFYNESGVLQLNFRI